MNRIRVNYWFPIVALAVCAAAGCGGEKSKIDFDAIGELRGAEQLVEVELGDYQIPIPSLVEVEGHAETENVVRFDFKLACVVAPEDAAELEASRDRQYGAIKNRVIMIFRQASLEDLSEGELSTVKTRLKDELQKIVGKPTIRRLVIPETMNDVL